MTNIKEQKKYFKQNFPNLGKILGIEKLKHDDINTENYKISTTSGQYVLRNFKKNSIPEQIEDMCRILNYCVRKKAKVYEPIRNISNKYVDEECKIFVTKYYQGNTYNGNSEQLQDLAKHLALLHKVLAKSRIKYIHEPNEGHYRILTDNQFDKIRKIIGRGRNEIDRFVLENIDYLRDCSKEADRKSKVIAKLRFCKQLLHHDLHPGNAFFQKNKVNAIIDFNSMRKYYVMKDISFASFRFAVHCTSDRKMIKKRIRLFLDRYKQYGNIDSKQFEFFSYFLEHEFLRRISYILRKWYLYQKHDESSWIEDLEKNTCFLRSVHDTNLLDGISKKCT